jgi:hypothetical protein
MTQTHTRKTGDLTTSAGKLRLTVAQETAISVKRMSEALTTLVPRTQRSA